MTALIKSGNGAFEPIRGRSAPSVPAEAPRAAPDPRDLEIAALGKALERAEAALATSEAEHRRALDTAFEKGRRAGRDEAEDHSADQLECLANGLAQAQARWRAELDSLDLLAPQLARAALARLFAGSDAQDERVTAMIARRVQDLRRGSVVAVRVSAADFGDADVVAALPETIGLGEVRASIDSRLDAGQCRIELKLGALDLDLAGQWRKLADLLDTMGDGNAA